MKRFLLVSNCLILTLSASSQYLEWNSLLKEGSGSQSFMDNAKINQSGNIICGGSFSGSIDLDPNLNSSFTISSPSGSSNNLFFASYDSDGDFIMGNHIWGKSNISSGGLDIDVASNIYMSGIFNDTIDLNPSSSQALYSPFFNAAQDAFLVKYNSVGVFQWARQLVSTIYTMPKDVALDQSGNIIVAGRFKGMTDFDPGSGMINITSFDEDIFIAKYNSNGNYLNAINIGAFGSTAGFQEVSNIEIDQGNNIYISGRFEGAVDFDPSGTLNVLNARGKNDFYIAKYNASLQLVWVYQMGSGRGEGLIDHKIYNNELWLAGSFRDTIDTDLKGGTDQLLSQGDFDVFFAKYNLNANLQFSNSFGGSGKDEAQSIDVYNADSLFISGHFEGTVDFDPTSGSNSLTASASQSTFFASYGLTGDLNWVSRVVGSGDVTNSLIRSNPQGKPHLIGTFSGAANFNDASAFTMPSVGPASFIAQYDQCGRMDISVISLDANCGVKDGSATATLTGGTAPMRYFWTSGHITSTADSLRSGLYYLTVKDTLNCTYYSDPVLISEIGGPSVALTSKLDVSCNGGNTGAIVLNVSGGTSPYDYSWSNGSTSQNINALKAGNYEVTVTDDDDCKSFLRVAIMEPDPIVVYPIVSKPACNTSNGSVTAVVTGGTPVYSYSWLPSGTGSTLFNISSGVYRVTVTDANNCTYTQAIPVNDDKAPNIYLDSVKDVSCGNGGGAIYVSISGGTPSYSYLWNPGALTTPDISGLQPNEYELRVTDNATCKSYFVQSIGSKKAAGPEICIVDVDSINGNAMLVWEKPTNRGSIDFYNVYRETSTLNVFDLVKDSIEFTELSLYEDKFADTWTRPWSYKISSTDTCGIESDLSDYHTTIHTVITKNAQNEFNILWSPYRGNFPVNSYSCYRYTDSTGSIDSLTTVPANIFTYTDVNSPSVGPDVYYFVKVIHPSGCTATDAQNRNSSRSNRGSIEPPKYLGKEKLPDVNVYNELILYPNPANDQFMLDLEIKKGKRTLISFHDMNGRTIWEKEISGERHVTSLSFAIDDIPNGLYLVKVMTGNDLYTGKLMVENH